MGIMVYSLVIMGNAGFISSAPGPSWDARSPEASKCQAATAVGAAALAPEPWVLRRTAANCLQPLNPKP